MWVNEALMKLQQISICLSPVETGDRSVSSTANHGLISKPNRATCRHSGKVRQNAV